MTIRQLFFSPLTMLAITGLAGQQSIQESAQTASQLNQEVEQLTSRVSDLENQLQQATSSAAQERIIRDELLMQKPGEFVIQLPDLGELDKFDETSPELKTPWEEWQLLLFQ